MRAPVLLLVAISMMARGRILVLCSMIMNFSIVRFIQMLLDSGVIYDPVYK